MSPTWEIQEMLSFYRIARKNFDWHQKLILERFPGCISNSVKSRKQRSLRSDSREFSIDEPHLGTSGNVVLLQNSKKNLDRHRKLILRRSSVQRKTERFSSSTSWEVFCPLKNPKKMQLLVLLLSTTAPVYGAAKPDPAYGHHHEEGYSSGPHCEDKKEHKCHKVSRLYLEQGEKLENSGDFVVSAESVLSISLT